MFNKKGKKATALLVLLLTLIMCAGTLLEGAAVFADTTANADTQSVTNETKESVSSTVGNENEKQTEEADVATQSGEAKNAPAVENSDSNTEEGQSAEITTDALTFKTIATDVNYVNVSGKKIVRLIGELGKASGYTASKYSVVDETAGTVLFNDVALGAECRVTITEKHVYRIQAEATDKNGNAVTLKSKESYSVEFPKAAANVEASCAKNDNLIKVTWSKSTDADRYAVYRSKNTTRPAKPLKYVTGTSFSERKKGGSYYYWVQPMNKTDFTAAGTYTRTEKVTAGNYLAIPVRNYYFTATAKRTIPIYKSAKSNKVIGHLKKGQTVVIKKKSPKVVSQYGVVKRVYFNDKKLKKKGWVKFSSIKRKNHVSGHKNDWSKSVKENYVNKKKFKSSTNYLIWLSKYTQRVNVFKRANKHSKWVLIKTYRCSTGGFTHPTPTNMNYILIRKQYDRHRVTRSGLRYYYKYLSAFGKKGSSGRGNAFHTVCWREGTTKTIKRVKQQPDTKGCARMFTGEAKWIYSHVPSRTRVISY